MQPAPSPSRTCRSGQSKSCSICPLDKWIFLFCPLDHRSILGYSTVHEGSHSPAAPQAKEKAVPFVRDVQGDSERAAEIERESLEDYAERRKIQLINPTRRAARMARTSGAPSKAELKEVLDEISGLADEALDPENERADLVRKLKDIADLAEGNAGAEDEGEEHEEDEE